MQQEVKISVNDVNLVIQVIKATTARGAIQPEEMVPVGALYHRMTEILKAGPVEPMPMTGGADAEFEASVEQEPVSGRGKK